MMANLVCSGAALACSMGTTPASFTGSGEEVSGPTAVGVISDTDTAAIPTFGLCQSPSNPEVAAAEAPQPCMPVIDSPWDPGSASVMIDGEAALDDSSQCECTWGGTITVSSPGQTDTTLE